MPRVDHVASLAGDATPSARGSRVLALIVLTGVGVALFAIRLTGLPNLLDNEYRVGACVLDVLQHGNWLCPHDVLGNTDKPPMLTWLAALASWPLGRVTRFTLYLPTALATVAIAWLIAAAGGRELGRRAGFLGALAYLLSHVGAVQMASARWDGLFTLTVAVAALAAFRAWTAGGGWTRFWLAAAVSTLTKGPLGVLLAGLGLGAVVWERRSGRPKPLEGSQAVGIVLFLLLTVGWFLLAYQRVGPHLVDDMIRSEFVGHVVEHHVGFRFWKPPGDFVANFAPWSVLAVVGLYRVAAAPASDDEVRRFERFLFCWFWGGLLVFCLAPHTAARLIGPIVPPAALLAGRELDRLAARLPAGMVARITSAVVAVGLAFFALEYHHLQRRQPEVRETLAIRDLARTIRSAVGDDFPLTYVADTPFAMQLDLDTMHPPVSFPEAASLLRGGAAAFVVVSDLPRLRRVLGADGPPLHELARASDGSRVYLYVVSNRPALAPTDPSATRVGALVVTLSGVRLGPAWDNTLAFVRAAHPGAAVIENASSAAQEVRVRTGATGAASRVLAPDATWRIEVP